MTALVGVIALVGIGIGVRTAWSARKNQTATRATHADRETDARIVEPPIDRITRVRSSAALVVVTAVVGVLVAIGISVALVVIGALLRSVTA